MCLGIIDRGDIEGVGLTLEFGKLIGVVSAAELLQAGRSQAGGVLRGAIGEDGLNCLSRALGGFLLINAFLKFVNFLLDFLGVEKVLGVAHLQQSGG